jgi:hypothetical protein
MRYVFDARWFRGVGVDFEGDYLCYSICCAEFEPGLCALIDGEGV